MSWSDDQKTPQRFEQNAVTAKKLTPHPAKAVMDQRWEERRARSVPPASEPTASGIQFKALTPSEPRLPPPIPLAALAGSHPDVLSEPTLAADSGAHAASPAEIPSRAPLGLLSNPQQALLVIALSASALVLALLYFGDFLH